MSRLEEFRALDRRIWWLAAARLVVTMGFAMVLPFLAMHLAIERGVPAFVVGLIWTIAGACGAAMQWIAGEIADRVGRKPLLVGSMLLRAANLALLGVATSTRAPIVWIGVLCVMNALLRAFFDPVCNAAIADLAPPERRVAAYSLQRVGINIGWAAGPALRVLEGGVPESGFFYIGAGLSMLATAGLARLAAVPHIACARRGRGLALSDLVGYLRDRAFARLLVATLLFFVLQAQLYQTLSIYAARDLHLRQALVGTLYTLNGVLVACLQLPAVRYINRLGARGALMFGSLGYAAAYASAGLADGYATLALVVAAVTVAEIVVAPAQQASVAALAPAGRVGAYSGLFGLCQAIGQSTGPLIGTAALDALPARAAWPTLAVFGVAAALLYRPSLTRSRGTTDQLAPHRVPAAPEGEQMSDEGSSNRSKTVM